jgi:apoptosis-inducing factor 3
MNDLAKPDLKKGVPLASILDGGKLLGVVDEEEVLLVRRGTELFAVGAYCTHYHGPLADGLVVDDQVRCPWHHACFNLRTGEALRAPALDPIQCWQVERVGENVFVREKVVPAGSHSVSTASHPSSIVIIGGGAAGLAAADMLRRKGYSGPLTMISADSAPPCDRPNLSKDFLAGTASDEGFLCDHPSGMVSGKSIWSSIHVSSHWIRSIRRSMQRMVRRTNTDLCCWRPEPIR